VDVRPSERSATVTAALALLLSTAGHMMLETARDALFLARLPPSTLPWMYLIIAGLGLLLTKLLPQRKKSSTASIAMVVAAVVALVFWLLLDAPTRPGLYALFIWTGTFGAVVTVELWLLLGGVFDVGQAKRLFGLIGAGAVLGATLGAFVARTVAVNAGAKQLLIAAAITFAVAAVPTLLLERKAAAMTAEADDVRDPEAARDPVARRSLRDDLRLTLRDRYLFRIGVFLVLGTITLAVVDYIFKSTIADEVDKEKLAQAFATYYLGFNVLSLIVQVAFTGLGLRLLGVQRALYVLPALVVAASVGVFVVPTLVAAVALRSTDGALRHSLHRTTTELLFLPLQDAERRRAKPVIDLLAQRGGQALAAVGVLLLVQLGAKNRELAVVTIVFGLAWIAVGTRVGGPYVDAFRKRLRRGAIDIDDRVPDLDLGALEALFSALNSSKDAEVMGALDMLSAQGRGRLIPALILYHPSKEVVLRALGLLVDSGRTDFLPVTKRLLDHADAEVRSAALRARAKVANDRTELESMLDDPRPEMRATALVALGATGGSSKADSASQLGEMLQHQDPVVMFSVIRAMGAEPMAEFAPELIRVAARSSSGLVRSEAAVSLGRVATAFRETLPEIAEALLELLPQREEGPYARAALASLGEPALAMLDRYLRTPEARGPKAWAAVRALREFAPEATAPMLLHHLRESPDAIVRHRCLRYLKRLRAEFSHVVVDEGALVEIAKQTMREAVSFVELRVLLEREAAKSLARLTAAGQLLASLLVDKHAHAVTRMFMLLGLVHPAEDFDRVARGLSSKDSKIRASSRELCQNVVGPLLREQLSSLIDDVDDDTRLDQSLGRDRRKTVPYEELLRELALHAGELGVLARYHARELGIELGEEVALPEQDDSMFVRKIVEAQPVHAAHDA